MKLQLIDTLKGHTGRVWNVKWNPSGTVLASCGEDMVIRIWCPGTPQWKLKTVLEEGHQKTIREVSWSPCGKYLASASFDATTAVWDNLSGEFECNATIEGHENEVKSVSWSKSGQYIATCSRDKSVWVWGIDNEDYECVSVLNAHSQDVKKVIWHPFDDVLVSASYDNTIKMYKEDPTDNEWSVIATLKSHESTVWGLAFDKSGTRLASCSDDCTVKIWKQYLKGNKEGVATDGDDPTWKCVCTLSGFHSRTVYDISWCHLTDLIATACSDNTIRIFKESIDSDPNEPTFELLVADFDAHDDDVNTVSWHPKEPGILASGSDDSFVKIWKVIEE